MGHYILFGVLIAISIAFDPTASCVTPSLPAGSTWVPSPDCPSGPTYEQTNPSRKHCRCWSHCGYICDPIAAATTTTTTTTTPECLKTCTFGGVWIPPNHPEMRCICQGANGCKYYLCQVTTTTAAPAPAAE